MNHLVDVLLYPDVNLYSQKRADSCNTTRVSN